MAYLHPGVANFTTSNGDACLVGIFFVRFYLADNHGLANFSSSVLGDIITLDEAEGVCASHALELGTFWTLYNALAEASKFIGIGSVPNVRKLWMLTQLAVL